MTKSDWIDLVKEEVKEQLGLKEVLEKDINVNGNTYGGIIPANWEGAFPVINVDTLYDENDTANNVKELVANFLKAHLGTLPELSEFFH